jgi:2-octaprenylphenol hydroxylase
MKESKTHHCSPQETSADCDVLIVGAGLVGATLALRLRTSGLRVGLLDKSELTVNAAAPVGEPNETPDNNDQPPKFDPRVVALTAQSQQLLDHVGVWQKLKQSRHCPYTQMRVWEQHGTGEVEFDASEIHEPALGTIIENALIVGALHTQIADCLVEQEQSGTPWLTLFMGRGVLKLEQRQEKGRPLSRLHCDDGSLVSAPLIIAADGGNSRLRDLAGFETREWDYGQKAIVTTIRTRLPHDRTALQRFLTTGPLAFLPLAEAADTPQGHYCSIVWSADDPRADELMACDENAFNARLSRAMEGAFGGVDWSDARYVFPLRQRHAKRYVERNVVLVGDAAHTIHPLAGQGVNLGMLDVVALAEALEAGAAARRLPEDSLILSRYQRRRIGPNLAMMGLMEGFKRGFGEQSLAVRWLRNSGLSTVNRFGPLRKALARKALGI